jgi:hypothetical protein
LNKPAVLNYAFLLYSSSRCSVLVSVLPFALFGIGFAVCPVWYRFCRLPCLVSVLPFALFGIGFAVCPVWYRSDTENTEPFFRTGSRVKD